MHNEATPSPFSAARIYERHTELMRYKAHTRTQTATKIGLRERDQGKQDSRRGDGEKAAKTPRPFNVTGVLFICRAIISNNSFST